VLNTFEEIIEVVASQVEQIPNFPESTNFWMVRSKKGIFYREYLEDGFIAIGWNALTNDILNSNDDKRLKDYLTEQGYKDKMPGTAINKCRRFISEVKKGDIAMIVGSYEIAFAIIGDYYEYESQSTTTTKEIDIIAQIDNGTYFGGYCPYKKRRHITIISTIDINNVSPSIYRCMVANRHSLSNLNEYADAIISASYDVAYYNNRLIVKYHIGQLKDINPVDFSLFTLNTVRLLAEDERSISGKYNINSEGDIVLLLVNSGKDIYEFIRDNIASLWLIYAILFGTKGFGFELPSAVDKIKDWVADALCWKDKRLSQKTEMDKAKAEIKKIEAETEQIKIDNEIKKLTLETMRKEKEEQALQIVQQLQQTAEPLDIKEPSPKIISLVNVLNKETVD